MRLPKRFTRYIKEIDKKRSFQSWHQITFQVDLL